MRTALQLFCYAVLALWYWRSSDPQRRSIMKGHRVAFFWAIGLTCGIIIENVYFQLIYDPSNLPHGMWIMAERNPFENALFICVGLAVLRGAAVSLRLRTRCSWNPSTAYCRCTAWATICPNARKRCCAWP